jgi:ketosteroid isomerase-like protein
MLDDADRESILALEARWLSAETEGRPEALRDLLTEDCALCPPDGPKVEGREAFLAAQAAPGDILDIQVGEGVIEGGPVHAWKTARFTTRLLMEGREIAVHGRHLWLMRKEAGDWRIAALSWWFERP